MRSRALGVARYRLRSALRRHRAGYLSVVLLVGLVGGLAMGSLQAARRTQAAYPTYLASTNPADLSVAVYSASAGRNEPSILGSLERLPDVRRVTDVYSPRVVPIAPDGAAELSKLGNVLFIASPDREFAAVDRLSIVDGRAADPQRSDEVVLDAEAARLLGVHVGSQLALGIFSQSQEYLPGLGTARVQPLARVVCHVVGIAVENNFVIEDDIDHTFGFAYLTPALLDEALRIAPAGDDTPLDYALQLRGGAAAVPRAEAEVRAALPAGATAEFHVTSRVVATDELAMRPMSLALGGFGAVAALACLVLGMQAVARLLREDEDDRLVLRSLGAGPLASVADALVGTGLAIVLGAGLAVGVAFALSPLSPLGPVRPVYPDPGFAADPTVYLLGAAVLVGVLLASAAVLGARQLGRRLAEAARASTVARGAEALGLPATCAVGIRFALERGSSRTTVPLRSALLGTVVAVTLVVATLTFASSFHTLISSPRLYGWNWSYALLPTNQVPDATPKLLDGDHDVAAWTGINYDIWTIDGVEVPILAEAGPRDDVLPPILSGHGVEAPDQIVVGASTLAELHRHVGQFVELSHGVPDHRGTYVAPIRMRVVGTATFPAIGYSSEVADHTSMGIGAMFTQAALPASFLRAERDPDPNLGGPELVFVRLRAGVSAAAGRHSLEVLAAEIDRIYASDPNAAENDVEVLGVQRPAQIVNYQTMGATPVLLAVGLAVGALAALALTLVASVRRRRRELAVMKALGFTPHQLAAAIAWQASVVAVVGVVVGVPLGVVVGRRLWILFAEGLNAVPDPTVPAATLALVALGTVLFAIAVAVLPGRSAGRTPTATVLRAD